MPVKQAGTGGPKAPKIGTAHRLRRRYYPRPLWDRYIEKVSEQQRAHDRAIERLKHAPVPSSPGTNRPDPGVTERHMRPPQPPSSSQPSRRFTGSSGPKFSRFPNTTAYAGCVVLVAGAWTGHPSAIMLGSAMVGMPVFLRPESRTTTEDSGPR